ncbi:MAG: FxsA family protein [Gammaproteobacteria bacterium]
MKYFLPTLIVLPVLELYVLIKAGSSVGALNTVGLVIFTALIGLVLLRNQGFKTLVIARNKIINSELPIEEILTGIFLAIGGMLLLIPGFITDFFGLMCLVPWSRNIIFSLFSITFSPESNFSSEKNNKQDWIEGEYKEDK